MDAYMDSYTDLWFFLGLGVLLGLIGHAIGGRRKRAELKDRYNAGVRDGKATANTKEFSNGYTKGRQEGYVEGKHIGIAEGKEQGRKEGAKEALASVRSELITIFEDGIRYLKSEGEDEPQLEPPAPEIERVTGGVNPNIVARFPPQLDADSFAQIGPLALPSGMSLSFMTPGGSGVMPEKKEVYDDHMHAVPSIEQDGIHYINPPDLYGIEDDD
jgi:hypothetical protein